MLARIILMMVLLGGYVHGISPVSQILLFPNTQSSPSLYLISFTISNQLSSGQYILINMDWLATPIDPYHCEFVNQTINIGCTNLATPSFTLTFTHSQMLLHNPQLTATTTLVIQLRQALSANTQHQLEIALLSRVPNLQKISPSLELYAIDKDGLVYEENLNFGPIIYKPSITNNLDVTVLNDLSQNQPGSLSSLRVQVNIAVPAITAYSTVMFVLQEPFSFSSGSYLNVAQSSQYSTSPIDLHKAPEIAFYEVKSPHIFFAVFKETFLANRKFIIQVTQISNPFQIAQSNISIYTTNFNSLTPLQAYESVYDLHTVTFDLGISTGIPYDMPYQQPCQFMKSLEQYFKVTFTMPKSIEAGYKIRVQATQMTIRDGSAFIDLQSLTYQPTYTYDSTSYFTITSMGPILQGTVISITFRAVKNTITNFAIDVYIDTQAIITAFSSGSYMFHGRSDLIAQDYHSLLYDIRDSTNNEAYRVVTYNPAGNYVRLRIYPWSGSGISTSSTSYVQFYFPPTVEFDADFNSVSDCRFSTGNSNSGVCTVTKTSNYVHIVVKSTASWAASYPNNFIVNSNRYIYIYKMNFPRTSSNKFPFMVYARLFQYEGVGAPTYIQSSVFSVVPRRDQLSGLTLEQHNNVQNNGFIYPGFLRFQSTNPSGINFVLQANQKRVLSVLSSNGIRGMGTINNQGQYPCTSNINVKCYYKIGQTSSYDLLSDWERVDVFFPDNDETTKNIHVIIPDTVVSASNNYYHYFIGAYNQLTKDYKYYYRNSRYQRTSNWQSSAQNQASTMMIEMEGKAGSYRNNVSINVSAGTLPTGDHNFLVITSTWSLFQNGISAYASTTNALSNPTFYTNELSPLSLLMGGGMYMTVIPFTCSPALTTFQFWVDGLHMPYHYNLPSYYIYVLSSSSNQMASYNAFQMTNAGIYYESPLKSLTLSCVDNYLGALNTICSVVFGTQHPLKADGIIKLQLSGMSIATNICHVYLSDGSQVSSTCSSTEDNKNVSIAMTDTNNVYHYAANNFTVSVSGVSIDANQISQSMTVYLQDSTGEYTIQTGTRILTTTVAYPHTIQIDQITYAYNTPQSSNTLSVSFYLPRTVNDDERLGFVMGKDLSDVNLEVKRLKIVLRRSDGVVIETLNELISAEYKILFTIKNIALVIPSNYTLSIYGIMSPASHENGGFSIIYQRTYDKAYTLTNQEETLPTFGDRIISQITMDALFNTEGLEQRVTFTIVNQNLVVDDDTVWIVNFPSYYYEELFNFSPYCMIDTAPIECAADPITPYQVVIKKSPKIVSAQTQYEISIHRLTSPRSIYTNDYYPSRYLFVGVLENSTSTQYSQTALLYPEQSIQQYINSILSIKNMQVATLTLPSFSTFHTSIFLQLNTPVIMGSFLYLIFPSAFDNFNNQPITTVCKVGGVLQFTYSATVIDRTLEIEMSTAINTNTEIELEFSSLPTPKLPGSVSMSEMIGFITPSNKKSVYASSSESGNSAPLLTFVADSRYISFNNDQTITITAGTYSLPIDIDSSDGAKFLTNINVNLSSSGFEFSPSSVFLSVGDLKGTFKVGADSGLLPIDYFYSATKSEEVNTYYTITQGNSIKVTNTPITINVPSSISIPIGGCSEAAIIDIVNAPFNDISISYNYDNTVYEESAFYHNPQTTKSQLDYTSNITTNTLSFCAANTLSVASFTLTLVLGGTNFRSYEFAPSPNITVNIVSNSTPPSPAVSFVLANRQKTYLQFNITTNVDGNVYYHYQLGQNQSPLNEVDLKIQIKNHQQTLQSMSQFLTTRVYIDERDSVVGHLPLSAGTTDKTQFSPLLPERWYTFCFYLETHYNQITSPVCQSYLTKSWGTILKGRVSFSSAPISDENLNKVLCFFTKEVDTEVDYVVDLEGNSCHDKAVSNIYFNYTGTTFSVQSYETIIYIITNPYHLNDPSPTAFQGMFQSSNNLSPAATATALSDFAINYLSARYLASFQAIDLIDRTQTTKNLAVSYDKPVYSNNEIVLENVGLAGGVGSIYFLLVQYKRINIDGNNTFVNIRLNEPPSEEEMLNCENWQGLQAQGCARVVFSSTKLRVTFPNIQANSLYIMYYVIGSEYPLRPILSSEIKSETIVTFASMCHLMLSLWLLLWWM